jgi:hypothetical protein
MNPIRLPRAIAKLKAFAETVTASHGRSIEIRQDATGATVTAADGHHLCRIIAPPPAGTTPGVVEPFLVDARAFSKAATEVGCGRTEALVSADPEHVAPQDRPLVVVKIDEETVGIAGPEGTPQTVKLGARLTAGQMPDCARIIDGIQAEAIDGETKAIARLDPRYLQNVADTAVALGITAIEITFSPKLNFFAAEGRGPDGCTAHFAIAGVGEIDFEAIASRQRPAWERDDALTFTMPEVKARKGSSSRRSKSRDLELPFDDIPF